MSGGRKVALADGFLNRYWDNNATARGEMLGDDLHLLKKTDRPNAEVCRDIRAACESGWDFSSRWLDESNQLETIRATKILPVDLNTLLYKVESLLSGWYGKLGDSELKDKLAAAAEKRSHLIQRYFWNDEIQFFTDYDFERKKYSKKISLAGVFPVFTEVTSADQAKQVAEKLNNTFLKDGGFVTSPVETGEQWDSPNGWAPLQWICYKGLMNYQLLELANEGKKRWLDLNKTVFKNTGKMLEKYNVENINLETGGGEYPVQDGFGWTNGVYLAMLGKPTI